MDVPGYTDSILHVDLSNGNTRKEQLDPELVRTLIGGYGINNRLAYDLIPQGVDPLALENLIIIGAGPFAGTMIPGAAKVLVTTKFPINGAYATAAGGGSFAPMLKTAGYDHVVISGRAKRAVYLKLTEGSAELCDAAELWGKDSFETIDELRRRYEPCSVIPIGQAGENLVKISISCVDKAGTLGRDGLSAIMGSKNLKAIVVQQGTVETNVAHRLALQKLVNGLHERIMRWPNRQLIQDNGLMPAPPDMTELHQKTRSPLACPSCPLADKVVVRLKEGRYTGLQTYMPHLGIRRFDARNSAEAYEQSVKYIDTLNRYGLCNMNFSHLLNVVVQLYREGVITREDTGGIVLRNDIETALKLARITALREGFGEVLADGLVATAKKLGKEATELIVHIKGHAIVRDPRAGSLGTMEFEQITTPRGAHVSAAGSPSYDPGRSLEDFHRHAERMGAPEEALDRIAGSDFNPGRYSRYSEDWYALFNCLSLCNRAQVNRFYHVKTIATLYSAVTGIDLNPSEMMKISERAWTIGKLLNAREGFQRKDDRAPEAWFKPLLQEGEEHHITDYYGTRTLTGEDVERYLDDYYDERGYDRENGLPTPEKLKELGLEDITAR